MNKADSPNGVWLLKPEQLSKDLSGDPEHIKFPHYYH